MVTHRPIGPGVAETNTPPSLRPASSHPRQDWQRSPQWPTESGPSSLRSLLPYQIDHRARDVTNQPPPPGGRPRPRPVDHVG